MNILDWHQWGLEDRMQEWLKINYAPPICLHSFAVELRHTHSRVFLALSFFLIVLVFEHSVQNTMTLYWHVFLIVAYGRQNGSVSNILTRDGSRYIFLVYIYYQYYHYYNIIITIYTHTLYNCMYVYIYIYKLYVQYIINRTWMSQSSPLLPPVIIFFRGRVTSRESPDVDPRADQV